MRIGIVTQPLNDNYGGILQNWALQQVLRDLGHDPITIDVYLKYPLWRYYLSYFTSFTLRLIGIKRNLPVKPIYGRVSSIYTYEFIHNYIKLTPPLARYTTGIIKRHKLDVLIVGSDQVWRPKYNYNIYDMYLDFAKELKCKKIAYAASFGVDDLEYSDEETEKCRELIKHFNAVSVREQSGVSLCKKYFDINAEIVLDPTLLLSRDRYETLCANIPKEEEKFLAAYCLDITEGKKKFIEKRAADKKLKLKLFSAHGKNTLTIPQWLSMFRDAEEVITDSFHGTVFSIIFNKQFVTLPNMKRGNSRLKTLYNLFGIKINEHTLDLDSVEINYSLLKERLLYLQDISKAYLCNTINPTNED